MMSANAPPKISAMTSSVMSRICHQRIFSSFSVSALAAAAPFLPDFLPFALCGGIVLIARGLAAAACGGAGLGCGLRSIRMLFARQGCAAASSSRMPPTGAEAPGAACCTGACALGRGAGCYPAAGPRAAPHSWGSGLPGALLQLRRAGSRCGGALHLKLRYRRICARQRRGAMACRWA